MPLKKNQTKANYSLTEKCLVWQKALTMGHQVKIILFYHDQIVEPHNLYIIQSPVTN